MATIQLDYFYALRRAGYLRKFTAVTGLYNYQKWHTATEILEYSVKHLLQNDLMYNACYDQLETSDDTFQLLLAALDYPKYRPRRKQRRTPSSNQCKSLQLAADEEWTRFLINFDFLVEDVTKAKPRLLESPRFYKDLTAQEKLKLRETLIGLHGDMHQLNIDEGIILSMVCSRINSSFPLFREVRGSLPPVLAVKNIEILEAWEAGSAPNFTIDWGLLTDNVDIRVIEALPEKPWYVDVLQERDDLTYNIIRQIPKDQWDVEALLINPSIPVEFLESYFTTSPEKQPAVKRKYADRMWRGVWRTVLYLSASEAGEKFRYHAAAGVVQRVWRRHRERLRRQAFARTLLDEPTYLTALPRDLQWLVYRFVRPASALRGLPPKFH